jgi:hypothetical protein
VGKLEKPKLWRKAMRHSKRVQIAHNVVYVLIVLSAFAALCSFMINVQRDAMSICTLANTYETCYDTLNN